MVNKNYHQIIQEIKLEDQKAIIQKEEEAFKLQDIEQLKENKTNKFLQLDFIPEKKEIVSNIEIKEEPKNEIKEEKEEETKNEINIEAKEDTKNEINIISKEETKDKAKKKKNRHKKNKKEKKHKIFEIPKTNPYMGLFNFKEVSKLRFQDNSIFRVINNWEEKEWSQTTPPTKDIDELFPNQIFPQGEIQPYLK